MGFTNEVYNSVNKYFSILSKVGYKSYTEVYKLIILLFIEELLCGPMSEFITKEDFETINNSLQCLYGNCMIPYPYNRGIDDKVFGIPYKCKIKSN